MKNEIVCPECGETIRVYNPGLYLCKACKHELNVGIDLNLKNTFDNNNIKNEDVDINKMPKITILGCFLLIIVLTIYSIFGLINNNIYLPGKYFVGIHFTGLQVKLVCFSFLLIIICLLSIILEYFDKKRNYRNYTRIQIILMTVSILIIGIVILSKIIILFI